MLVRLFKSMPSPTTVANEGDLDSSSSAADMFVWNFSLLEKAVAECTKGDGEDLKISARSVMVASVWRTVTFSRNEKNVLSLQTTFNCQNAPKCIDSHIAIQKFSWGG
jgi:hypothetical protein